MTLLDNAKFLVLIHFAATFDVGVTGKPNKPLRVITQVENLMTFRKIFVLPLALVIAASSLSAFQAKPVDVTGVWTGTFTPTTGEQDEAHMDLKQKGAEVTGTAGPGRDRQVPIANGKVTTVKGVTSVTFDATPPNGRILRFDLKVVEGRLKGKAMAEFNGETREALVDVGRAK
jgi:hypothetical protein